MRAPLISPNRRVKPSSVSQRVPVDMADNLRGAMWMVLCMAAFTCNDSLMKAVTHDLPLYQSISIRGGIVMLFMVALAWFKGKPIHLLVPRRDVGPLVLRGVSDIVSTLLYLAALRQMALADISAVMQALPLAVTLAAAVVFREKLGWRRLSAIGVGFVGVLLILRPGSSAFDVWSLVALAAMGLIVVRDIATRLFSPQVDSSTIAFHAALAVTLGALVMGTGEDWRMPLPSEVGLLVMAGALLTVGYLSAVASMRVGEVSFVAPFRYTSLIWAIVLGLLMFGDWPDLWTWAGSALVVGAGIYAILRERQLRRVY
ncbi:DMT family transporter [Paracoccus aestuariivivens]|uniref:EamA family transporter n=1 Tax=Paracoccus aestuariivivens TaxID=1820333 RepID=A0A6L6JAJ6_9RHOB|nr:DMT family transporter [Paracoccus aestuariivivens]MTH77739.1 EamA family transporter [Paracoccus aestuariivivens]